MSGRSEVGPGAAAAASPAESKPAGSRTGGPDVFRGLFDRLRQAVVIYEAVDDGKDFRIAEFNPAAEALECVRRADVVGRLVTEAFPGVEEFGLLEVFRRVWRTGQTEKHPIGFYEDDRLSGWRENEVYRLSGGEVVAVYEDRTEAKLAEQRSWFLSSVPEQSTEGMALASLDGRLLFVNRAWARMHGYDSPEELLGQPLAISHTPEQMRNDVEPFNRHVFEHGSYSGEVGHLRRDGTTFPTLMTSTLVRDKSGKPAAVVGIAKDITEFKAVQAELVALNERLEQRVRDRTADLEAANVELQAFTYTVSHDLRAPLTSIGGLALLLEEEHCASLDQEALKYVRQVRASAERASQLVSSLLTLSRLSRSELARQAIDLSQMAAEIVAELRLREPGRAMTVTIAPKMRCRGDPTLLRTVLENLLGNAWKFTGPASEPRIEFCKVRAPRGQVGFCIRDNGVGFDPRLADKLFGVFHRLHAATEFPGAGVGLAAVERVVRRHGGRVWAESKPGEGASFFFTLGETPACPA